MARNVKHMRWWPRPWEYRQAEAWLTDMAAKGWRLQSIGFVFAKFINAEPAPMRYRCVLYDSTIMPSDVDALELSYLNAGWKSLGYKKNVKVFSIEADDRNVDDPIDLDRQEKLARKCINAKIIWVILSVLLYVGGFCWLNIDLEQYLNFTIKYEIIYAAISLWFINYWVFSISDLLKYFRLKKYPVRARPDGSILAPWIIHVLLLTIFLVPEPYNLARTYMEPQRVAPTIYVSNIVEVSQAPFSVDEDEICIAIDGYGVFFPYRRVEFGAAELLTQGSNADDVDSSYFSVLHYRALFDSSALSLCEKLEQCEMMFGTLWISNEPLQPKSDTMGFDRLWIRDDYSRQQHAVLAVLGCDVFFIDFDGPINSDQLITFLKNHIETTQEATAP